MFSNNYSAVANTSTASRAPTVAQILDSVRLLRERCPLSEIVRRYRMSAAMFEALKQQSVNVQQATISGHMFHGVPVEIDDTLRGSDFVSERADGTEVLHSNGQEHRRPSVRQHFNMFVKNVIQGEQP
jgi:hypothetical protein